LIPGRFWGVFFTLLASGFITETYLRIKGIRGTAGKSVKIITFLIFLSLPYFILLMWREEQLTTLERAIDSAIAFICVVAGIVNLYVENKR